MSLDASGHCHSRSRCCPCCCQREIEALDAHGQEHPVTAHYHRYVLAQINGPRLNVLLDPEPIRPGEAEADPALRLVARMRRVYGVRFFDEALQDDLPRDLWFASG